MDVFFWCLILGMGSPEWAQREKCQSLLVKHLPHSAAAIKAACKHNDPEIAARCRAIYLPWWTKTCRDKAEKMTAAFYDKAPWIDMLPKQHPQRHKIIDYYLAAAGDELGHQGPPEWEHYRLASKWYFQDLLFVETAEPSIQALIDQMAVNEHAWITKNHYYYSNIQLPTWGLPEGSKAN